MNRMNRTRIAAALAGAAVAAGALAAAVPAGAVTVYGDPAFRSANGLFLAELGSPVHPGSSASANCRVVVPPAVSAQTSFVTVPLGGGTFLIQWANGDGRALDTSTYIAGVGGPSQFVGNSHSVNASTIWHAAGGQIRNGLGLALDLLPGGGVAAIPAGGAQAGAQITELTGVC
jgi:hypothetical protein